MKNNSSELRRINIYKATAWIVFLFLAIIIIFRLSYLGSQDRVISYNYNFYTGTLPAFLVIYFGIDFIFYLQYLRIKIKQGSYKKVLYSWALICSTSFITMLLFPILLERPPGQPLTLNYNLFPIVAINITLFLVSLPIPIILSQKGEIKS